MVAWPDQKLVGDGCKFGNHRDGFKISAAVDIPDGARATLEHEVRDALVQEGALVGADINVVEKIRHRDGLLLVEQFHVHVAEACQAVAEPEANLGVAGSGRLQGRTYHPRSDTDE